MGRFVDSIIAYRILKLLVTPFEDTDAFRLGIIDNKGKELKRMAQLNTVAERDAYTILHRLVFRLKRIVEKVPLENKKLLNFAAALALIKEHYQNNYEPINLEEQFVDKLNSDLTAEMLLVEEFQKSTMTFRQFLEDAPANASSGGGVAGFTPDTVGVSKKVQKKRTSIFRRGGVQNVSSINTKYN